jgi:hypothetical protein
MRIQIRFLALAALVVGACATSSPPPLEVKSTGVPGQALGTQTEKVTVTVKAVDVAKRTITVAGKDGETETFKVDPAVRRLNEIAPGDAITVEVTQGLLLEYLPAGTAAVPGDVVVAGAVAGAQSAPGAAVAASLQGTVTVVNISSFSRIVTFQDADGNQYKVKAGPKIALDKLKVGDRLFATYLATVAIGVEKGGAKL